MTNLTDFEAKKGRRVTKPKRVASTYMINTNLSDYLQKAQIELSNQTGKSISVSDIVNDSIEYYLDVRGIKL